jgi:hypothetical protein
MGRYIDDILQPGEKVLYSTNAHWIYFLPAIVGWGVAIAIFVVSGLIPAGPMILVCWSLAAIVAIAGPPRPTSPISVSSTRPALLNGKRSR